MSSIAYSQNVKTYIPQNAYTYLPVVRAEERAYFPSLKYPYYFPALIEQESCLSLKHSKCFNPHAELKTSRERGVGFGQTTVAFNRDGSTRFDALQGMKDKYQKDLKELTWGNIKNRPDLQARTMVLMIRDLYKTMYFIQDDYLRLQFVDSGYNGGPRDVNRDRTICGMKRNCNPQVWFDNVETTCSKSKKPLYGQRNACMINREHVTNVFKLRINKYKSFFQ